MFLKNNRLLTHDAFQPHLSVSTLQLLTTACISVALYVCNCGSRHLLRFQVLSYVCNYIDGVFSCGCSQIKSEHTALLWLNACSVNNDARLKLLLHSMANVDKVHSWLYYTLSYIANDIRREKLLKRSSNVNIASTWFISILLTIGSCTTTKSRVVLYLYIYGNIVHYQSVSIAV